MAWLYVPGLGASNSGLGSGLEKPIELWVTLSGKPSQRPFSWHGWKTRAWIALLSGMISRPSTADRGVAEWISSLLDTRVSHSASQVSDKGQPILAISGPTLPESSERSNPYRCSWRTSEDISGSASERLLPTFEEWVTRLRRACLLRRKSARPTDENASSRWATAAAHDGRRPGPEPTSTQGRNLKREAEQWQTPSHPSFAKRQQAKQETREELLLPGQAEHWATPSSMDYKDSAGMAISATNPDGTARRRLDRLGRQALQSAISGLQSLPPTRRLNPRFVEWLMGLPLGWTDYAHSATESFRLWLHTHTELLARL
jgi:hypothetical protein